MDQVIALTCVSWTRVWPCPWSKVKPSYGDAKWTCSDQEIAALLAKSVDETIQTQLLRTVCNVIPYRTIANELCRQGFEKDYKQCREKIKALKKKTMDSLKCLEASMVSPFAWIEEGMLSLVFPPPCINQDILCASYTATSYWKQQSLWASRLSTPSWTLT